MNLARRGIAANILAASALASALLFSPAISIAQGGREDLSRIRGIVTHVEDGDTLRIRVGQDSYSIRLADIDAPETRHSVRGRSRKRPGQMLGAEAAGALSMMALGKEAMATCRGASYNRTVCYVSVGGKDMSTELALLGLAWWEPRYGKRPRVKAAETDARYRQVGLWAPGLPGMSQNVEPWVWRQMCWTDGKCPGSVGP